MYVLFLHLTTILTPHLSIEHPVKLSHQAVVMGNIKMALLARSCSTCPGLSTLVGRQISMISQFHLERYFILDGSIITGYVHLII